jgi:hypothetical protein
VCGLHRGIGAAAAFSTSLPPHFFFWFLARRGQRLQRGFDLQHFFLTFFDMPRPRRPYENSITLRMPSWASISSKPRFTSSKVIRCEMNESTSMSPSM